VKRAAASAAAAATVASSASWRLILLPLVREDPAGGGIYLCCLSGGGREDGGSMFGLGEMDCFTVSFPNVVGDGIQVLCPSSLRKGGVLARPWDCALCLRRCFSHRRWTSGLLVGGGVSSKGLLFPFPSLRGGGRCSFSVYDACWRSRRWFMRQIHALEPFVEEDGGSTLVGALVTGDRKLRAVARSWGCCDVNSSYSRVFLANFQGCTVLFY